jgi:glycine/D-amino acid oxidase-like deaminating enzyme
MQRCDLLVVGGGVLGLWIARFAAKAGASVILADAAHCGAGASGGVLGALMPHTPTGWNVKKQFQFDALLALESHIRELESETSLDAGYRRCGRIIPIRKHGFLAEAERRGDASRAVWQGKCRQFMHGVYDSGHFGDWFAAEAAPFGLLHDDLSARLSPVRTVGALKASVLRLATVLEGWSFERFDGATHLARARTGKDIQAGHVVLAAGYQTFELLGALSGANLGSGVKGQAAVLAAELPDGAPIIYDDGVYIVPHDDGTVAVGSTTEKEWDDPAAVDEKAHRLVARARALCPLIADAPVLRYWAGVRPKCHERDPIVGFLPGQNPLYVATGGFKITFGIAHRLAECAVAELLGADAASSLPETFRPAHHLSAAGAHRS